MKPGIQDKISSPLKVQILREAIKRVLSAEDNEDCFLSPKQREALEKALEATA